MVDGGGRTRGWTTIIRGVMALITQVQGSTVETTDMRAQVWREDNADELSMAEFGSGI